MAKSSQATSSAVSDASDTSSAICAWCIEEQGEQAQPGDSHGICEPHAEQILVDHYMNQFCATPSYVERFADGRESWEVDA